MITFTLNQQPISLPWQQKYNQNKHYYIIAYKYI